VKKAEVEIIHHSTRRKERCIMKKIAIISTGLLFGFFVFLTGFPTADAAKDHIRTCDATCKSSLNLSSTEATKAKVLLLLGEGGRVLIYEITPTVIDDMYDEEVPGHRRQGRNRVSGMTYWRGSPGCVTINGRNYCW